jgi:hypothetical protein
MVTIEKHNRFDLLAETCSVVFVSSDVNQGFYHMYV